MKTLYFECNMGAAGDMLFAALLELHPDPDAFLKRINELNIPNVRIEKEVSVKCGITGTHVLVSISGKEEESIDIEHVHDHFEGHNHGHRHDHEHTHTGMHEIEHLISHISISGKVRKDILSVYKLIAEAESHVHGKPVSEIHFHEVGMMDALADITGVCMLMDEISPDHVIVSPIHVGTGQVKCAHGILPVPAPATAYLLKGIPTYGGAVKGELCTPTGAALLKYFAHEFAYQQIMITEKIGYGMGKKDFTAANCVRVFLGKTTQTENDVAEIGCNIDDMTGEALGFAQEVLFENGALDVFTIPIQMKKSRPGQMLCCICEVKDIEKISILMLKHTTTFGVRTTLHKRYILDRRFSDVETKYGTLSVKTGSGYGITKTKAEYEDVAKAAKEYGVTISDVVREIK